MPTREVRPCEPPLIERQSSHLNRKGGALTLLAELNGDTGLMHGDCSRGNLLMGEGRWWLIDPRGVRGDWQYDVAVAAWKCRYSADEQAALVCAAGADHDTVEAWGRVARAARA